MKSFTANPVFAACALGAALLLSACGNSAQKTAYAHAVQLEQESPDRAKALLAEYQQVIRLDPGSDWARKARARIDAIEARMKADELHKSVFQEHGVD